MGDGVKIEVRGLRELRTAFNKVDKQLPKELSKGFKKIAEMIASSAAAKVPSISGRAAGSIKPRATTRGASIAFGGNSAPYYPWLDFGGRVGRKRSIQRSFIKEGRYIYPTIREHNKDIVESVDNVIERLAKRAGFDTKG